MQTTTNFGLKKPDGTDAVNIQDFNDNADVIDQKLKEAIDAAAVIGSHAATHQPGGTDPLPTAAPSGGLGTANAAGSNTSLARADHTHLAFDSTNPAANGTASPGSATTAARRDHVHPTDSTRAPLASPAFTGTPTAPTVAVDTSTMQLATTAFVINQAGTTTPLVNGAAAVGVSKRYARIDHVHPTDTSRVAQTDFDIHNADYTIQIPYAVTTGSANTYTVSTSPSLPSLVAGVAITVKIHAVNTGTSTINWNDKGAKSIKKSNGSDVAPGNLKLNGVYTLRYDGTNFILQGEGGEYGTAGASQVLSGYSVGTEAGLVNGSMPEKAGATLVNSTSDNVLEPDGFASNANGSYGYANFKVPSNGHFDETTVFRGITYGLNPDVVKAGQKIGGATSSLVGTYTGIQPIGSLLDSYQVDSGQTITAGQFVTFVNNKIRNADSNLILSKTQDTPVPARSSQGEVRALKLSDNKVLYTYTSSSNPALLKACVITFNGKSISMGTEVTLVSISTSLDYTGMNLLLLDSTKVVLYYAVSDGCDTDARIKLVGISGSTIDTSGVAQDVGISTPGYAFILTATTFLLGSGAMNKIITFSGLTISSVGTNYNSGLNSASDMQCCLPISSNKFLLIGVDGSDRFEGQIVTISGTTISFSTSTALGNIDYTYISRFSVLPYTSNKFLIIYREGLIGSSVGDILAIVVTVDTVANTVSAGAPIVLFADVAYNEAVLAQWADDNKTILVILSNNASGSGSAGQARYVNVTSGPVFTPNVMNITFGVGSAYSGLLNSLDLICYHDYSFFIPFGDSTNSVCIIGFEKLRDGMALQSGSAGATISCYDWRNS